MSPRSKREYLEAIYVRYKKPPVKAGPSSWMSSVPPPAITASMPFDCSVVLNASPGPSPGNEGGVPYMTTLTFSYP